jgi:hypothetical protein
MRADEGCLEDALVARDAAPLAVGVRFVQCGGWLAVSVVDEYGRTIY